MHSCLQLGLNALSAPQEQQQQEDTQQQQKQQQYSISPGVTQLHNVPPLLLHSLPVTDPSSSSSSIASGGSLGSAAACWSCRKRLCLSLPFLLRSMCWLVAALAQQQRRGCCARATTSMRK
jgi:hypothetical protein